LNARFGMADLPDPGLDRTGALMDALGGQIRTAVARSCATTAMRRRYERATAASAQTTSRTWTTRYRGVLAIQAGQRFDRDLQPGNEASLRGLTASRAARSSASSSSWTSSETRAIAGRNLRATTGCSRNRARSCPFRCAVGSASGRQRWTPRVADGWWPGTAHSLLGRVAPLTRPHDRKVAIPIARESTMATAIAPA
jgi:hypothetical protein